MIRRFIEEVENIELLNGAIIEEEHFPTYCMIKKCLEETGQLITPEQLYNSISVDHINESMNKVNPYYYDMLILMEKLMEMGITSSMIKEKFGIK
jgi:hypothetical protein